MSNKAFSSQAVNEPAGEAAPDKKVFISYRRKDDPDIAVQIYELFCIRFQEKNVFFDDNIQPGEDWEERLRSEVTACDALIVVIGPNWLDLLDEHTNDPEEDFVRFEIEMAIKLNKQIVPILIKDASLPPKERLPESLRPILKSQAAQLKADRSFLRRCREIIDSVYGALTKRETQLVEKVADEKVADEDETQKAKALPDENQYTAISFKLDTTYQGFDVDQFVDFVIKEIDLAPNNLEVRSLSKDPLIIKLVMPATAARWLKTTVERRPETFNAIGLWHIEFEESVDLPLGTKIKKRRKKPKTDDDQESSAWPKGFKLINSLRGHQDRIQGLHWVKQDKRALISVARDETLQIWNASGSNGRKKGHPDMLRCISWAPDNQKYAYSARDEHIHIRDLKKGDVDTLLKGKETHKKMILSLAWAPDNIHLASGSSDYTIRMWHIENGVAEWVQSLSSNVLCLAWSPDGKLLAAGTQDGSVRLMRPHDGHIVKTLNRHDGAVQCLVWSPDGSTLASGADDQTIILWNIRNDNYDYELLEGHTSGVLGLSFSYDSAFLASQSRDNTVRIWGGGETWRMVGVLHDPQFDFSYGNIAFHPSMPILATVAERERVIRLWNLNWDVLRKANPIVTVRYASAKVVVLGNRNFGKTSLVRRLLDKPLEDGSSDLLRVHLYSQESAETKRGTEQREIYLWDTPGQRFARQINQLHLKNTVLALIVTNGADEDDPLRGMAYWDRALQQAQQVHNTTPGLKNEKHLEAKKLLVVNKIDRAERVDHTLYRNKIAEMHFDDYFLLSATTGQGIKELTHAIHSSIDWNKTPRVSSTKLFGFIKKFLTTVKNESNVPNAYVQELYAKFLKTEEAPSPDDITDLYQQFEACIAHLEAQGIVRIFSKGLILMQPELLGAYAAAIIKKAGENPKGLGTISERAIWNSELDISEDFKIQEKAVEQFFLLETVDDLLLHEIAFRAGEDLVFPSQFTTDAANIDTLNNIEITYHFEGAVMNIYAPLVVRLSRTKLFKIEDPVHSNMVTFKIENIETKSKITYGSGGIAISETSDGRGTLHLFFDKKLGKLSRALLDKYVGEYLNERAVAGSVERHRKHRCVHCGYPVEETQREMLIKNDITELECLICAAKGHPHMMISLEEPELSDVERNTVRLRIADMDRQANQNRNKDRRDVLLRGKLHTENYDIFLAYNQADMSVHKELKKFATQLIRRGIHLWHDPKNTPPERWYEDIIEKQIPKVRSIGILIGAAGLKGWDVEHLIQFILKAQSAGRNVIFIMMPEANFTQVDVLQQVGKLHWIYFDDNVEEVETLDKLESSITGHSPLQYQ